MWFAEDGMRTYIWFSVAFGTNSSVSELKAMYATKMLIAEKYFVLAIGCYAME